MSRDQLSSTVQQQSANLFVLLETDAIKSFRLRSYHDWPYFTPSSETMSASGWFCCNIGDRVMCIYCNTVCHQWISDDDPFKIHAILQPSCPYVLSLLRSPPNPNAAPMIVQNFEGNKFQPFHPSKRGTLERKRTFDSNRSWNRASPSVVDFVNAGFFYSTVDDTVICFYCDGSLRRWSDTDDPKIEHARWFPHCLYAKHLCGDELHFKIQRQHRIQSMKTNLVDKIAVQRAVNARLDLPIVLHLRNQYGLPAVRRSVEDQLKIRGDDFSSVVELELSCLIYNKQIDIFKKGKVDIIVPSQITKSNCRTAKSTTTIDSCILCSSSPRQVACLPCGHFYMCVPCAYSFETCPICRQKVQSYFRVNT